MCGWKTGNGKLKKHVWYEWRKKTLRLLFLLRRKHHTNIKRSHKKEEEEEEKTHPSFCLQKHSIHQQ